MNLVEIFVLYFKDQQKKQTTHPGRRYFRGGFLFPNSELLFKISMII